jgi:ABC-type nickel/cobalt efflux system permease component RcnA
METHELLGFITLAIFGVLAVWRIWRERRMGTTERALALALSLGGAGVLIATAAYGGRLVFDHAAGIPTEVLTSETRERADDHEHAAGEGHGDDGHEHEPATAPMAGDSAATAAAPATGDHVDPPGTPPHSHEPEKPAKHSDPPGAPAHDH